MNNWSAEELAFRCERLSVRMEQLAKNFSRLASLSLNSRDGDTVLGVIRQNKVFLELTAIDLDVDAAFELAQMQRQLSRWHVHWAEVWRTETARQEIAVLAQTWAQQLQAMAGVLV